MFFRRSCAGLSVGSRQVALVEGKKKGGTIRSCRVEALPAGTIVPSPIEPNIAQPEAYRKGIDLLLNGGESVSRLYLGLPDGSVRLAVLDFQSLPKQRKDVEQLIRWQMEKVFLYPLKGTRLAFQELGESEGRRRLLAMAIRNEILAQYEAPLKEKGIEPVSIGIVSFHLFNLYLPFLLSSTEPSRDFVFLSRVDQSFTIMICRRGAVDFVRVKELPAGLEEGRAEAVSERILAEISTSLAFYHESTAAPDLHHLFLSSDPALSDLDETLREKFGLTPIHLSPEGAGVLSLPDPAEGRSHSLLTAAAALIGGSD
jgi:Tfp pilus assembly PilM family ATPase